MARSTGQYFSGTLPGVVSGQRLNFFNLFKSSLEAFLSAGTAAWQSYYLYQPGPALPRDQVWRSLGDRNLLAGSGDANLFVRAGMDAGGVFSIDAYQDVSTAAGATLREAAGAGFLTLSFSDTAAIDYWGVRNEYEYVMILRQSGTTRIIAFGSPRRIHIASVAAGIARATGNVTAGSPRVIPVDRDLTGLITVGQRVWVYDVVDTGAAFPGGHDNAEVATVTAVAAGSITVATLVNAHGTATSKAIVGLDPCPMYAICAGSAFPPTWYMTNALNATYAGASANSCAITPFMVPDIGSFGPNGPARTGLYIGASAGLSMNSPIEFRGSPQHIHFWPIGTQVDGDRMLPNFSTALAEKIFPSIPMGGGPIAPAIGPGAT